MEKFIVQKSITLHASPDAVWDALTNPEKTRKFFFHCRVFSDWKVGSTITFKGKVLFLFPIELNGKILEVIPQQKLVYNLINRKSGSVSVVTDSLTPVGASTVLTISDNVGEGEGAQKRYERSLKGWDKILSGLKKLVEA